MRVLSLVLPLVAALTGCTRDSLVIQTVSEYGGSPVAGVEVKVGDGAWVATGADGRASLGRAHAPYAVQVHQVMAAGSHAFHDVWSLTGQTADTLVLAVDGSAVPASSSSVIGMVTGRSGLPGTAVRFSAGDAGGGSWAPAVPLAADGLFGPDLWWEGTGSQPFVLRALESDDASPPAQYSGYGATRVVLSDPTGQGGSLAGVTVPLLPVGQVHVTGQVAVAASLQAAPASAHAWLEFPDLDPTTWNQGATFSLGEVPLSGPTLAFDAVFPLTGARGRLRASAGTPGQGWGFHERRVALPSGAVAFDVPAPVTLLEPAAGAAIQAGTVLRWSAPAEPGRCRAWLLCEFAGGNVNYRALEAEGAEATVPDVPGVTLPSGAACRWGVAWTAASDTADSVRASWSEERSATTP